MTSQQQAMQQTMQQATPQKPQTPKRSSIDQEYLDAVRSMGLTVETEFTPIPPKKLSVTSATSATSATPIIAPKTPTPPLAFTTSDDPHEAFFRKLELIKIALAKKVNTVPESKIAEIMQLIYTGKSNIAREVYAKHRSAMTVGQQAAIKGVCLNKLGAGSDNPSTIEELMSICAALD